MISAYVGLPGAGKSYAVVANVIMPALKEGRRVVTNIPLVRDEVRKITPKGEICELPIEAVATNPETIDDYCTAGCVLVLDEAWRLWPAGVKSNQVPESFRSLLAEHRHKVDREGRSTQIVIVTQDLQQISAWARSLIEITFVHTQLGHVGANRKYRVASYRGAVDTIGAPQSRVIREAYGTYRAAVYKLYTSHTMREGGGTGSVDEKAIDKRATIWGRPMVWAGLGFVVIAPVWAGTTLYSLFLAPAAETLSATEGSTPGPAAPAAQQTIAAPSPPPVAERPRAVAEARKALPAYRVSGYVRSTEGRDGYVMIEAAGRWVTLPIAECWFAGDGLTRCSFDGFTVTEFGVSNER